MIGIFDSGSGGLTVLKGIRERMPSVDIVYFGDNAYAPYGNRSREEISQRTMHALKTLLTNGATSIVSACNSVSASLAISLYDSIAIRPDRLIEMVGPTVSGYRDSSARILLVATDATIRSEIYQNAFRMIGKEVHTLAIPALAGAIEEGAPAAMIERMIRDALAHTDLNAIDTVLLACTHYPLAYDAFRLVLPGHIAINDPAEMVAERVEQWWWPREVGNGSLRFILTKESPAFRARLEALFPGAPYTVEVVE